MSEPNPTPTPPSWEPPKPLRCPLGPRELRLCLILALISLALGNCLLMGGLSLGFSLGLIASILTTWRYLSASGHRGTWYTRTLLILALAIAAGFGYSGDYGMKALLLLCLMAATGLAFCLMAGQHRRDPGTILSLLDAPRAFFSLGWGKSGPALGSLADHLRGGSVSSRRAGALLLGLAIALPLLGLLIPLLMFSDAAFEGLMDQLPSFDGWELVGTLFFALVFFTLLFPRAVALHASDHSAPAPDRFPRLNRLTVHTVLTLVCLTYCAYLVSQLAYFVSGFAGILPDGYSAAQYARRGFFEMALLCAINLSLMALAMALTRQMGNRTLTRLLCLFLGLVTLFLVGSSCAKMVLYIRLYGLTRLRVLTMAVIAFLALATVLLCLWLFRPRLKYMPILMIAGLSIGVLLLWTDVDTQVARYNVTAYRSGALETVDVTHLAMLGEEALPWLIQLAEDPDPEIAQQSRDILAYWGAPDSTDLRGWTYASHKLRPCYHSPYVNTFPDFPGEDSALE